MTWTDFKQPTLAGLHKRLSRRPYADHAEAFIRGARAALSAWTRHTYNLPALQDRIATAEGLAEAADALLKRIKYVQRSRSLEADIDAEIVSVRHMHNLPAMQERIAATEGFAEDTHVMHKRIKKGHAGLVFGTGARRLSEIAKDVEVLAGAAHAMAGNIGRVKSEVHPKLREKAMVGILATVWRQTMQTEPSVTRGSTFAAICDLIGANEFDMKIGPESLRAAKTPT